jgi:hypothetical protein
MSEPFFQKRGLAIDQNVYKKDCIQKRLIPFLKTKHFDDNYMFWPDKALAHRLKCSSLANEKFYVEFLLGDIAFDIQCSL